jgi:hypothetical protein
MTCNTTTGNFTPLDYYRAAHRNALLDALPKLNFRHDIAERLSFLPPPPDEAVRGETAGARLNYLGELVRIHVALNRDLDLAQSVDSMIRDGYLARGSVASQRAASAAKTAGLVQAAEETSNQQLALNRLLVRASEAHTPSETRSLIGISGTGKSRTLHQIFSLYPKHIAHPASRDPRLPPVQIPCLLFEAPADRTIASFQAAAIRAIEQAIDAELPSKLKIGNRSERIGTLADLLQHFHTGIIAIDEIQKLIRANRQPDHILLNFILEIANTLRVPILFVGTPASQRLLTTEMRNARRMLGRPWINYAQKSPEWARLVAKLWLYQFTAEFAPLDDDLRTVVYEETMGLPGLLVRLFRETQRVLILANSFDTSGSQKLPERVTPSLLHATAKAIFAPIRPMLSALRSGKAEETACFEDLCLDDSLVDAQIQEIAEFRRREFRRTVQAVRNAGSAQRRRAKATLRQEVDELLGYVPPSSGLGAIASAPTNTDCSPISQPIELEKRPVGHANN